MIINVNDVRRINYDNVVEETLVESKNGSVKVKFSLVDKTCIILQMSLPQYENFKMKTGKPKTNQVIDITCVIVDQLLYS